MKAAGEPALHARKRRQHFGRILINAPRDITRDALILVSSRGLTERATEGGRMTPRVKSASRMSPRKQRLQGAPCSLVI